MSREKLIIIVDDSRAFLDYAKAEIEGRFDAFAVCCYDNPLEALKVLNDPFDLLLLDWEMAGLDGRKFLNFAKQSGIPFHKIIIISAHTAEELHDEFKVREVLSVINKSDPNQMKAFFMILANISRCGEIVCPT